VAVERAWRLWWLEAQAAPLPKLRRKITDAAAPTIIGAKSGARLINILM